MRPLSAVNATLQSSSQLYSPIQFGGQSHGGSITCRGGWTAGAVPSWIPDGTGEIHVEVDRNSAKHQQFLAAHKSVRDAGSAGAFDGTMAITDISTGASHTATGVAFSYLEQAQRVFWKFICCNIVEDITARLSAS
jgi:hypothetical protein